MKHTVTRSRVTGHWIVDRRLGHHLTQGFRHWVDALDEANRRALHDRTRLYRYPIEETPDAQ